MIKPTLEQAAKNLIEGFVEENSEDDSQRAELFKKTLEKELGLKSTMVTELKRDKLSGPRFRLDFSSKRVHIGSTAIWIGSGYGDSLFGSSSGLFTAAKIITLQDKVSKVYLKKFPMSTDGTRNRGL